jgi:tetratricopeptide (TPR) repeat protein
MTDAATDVTDAADAFEVGLLVETHSLSREDLNGKQGFCTTWDDAKGRWGIALVGATTIVLAVRPGNLRVAAAPAPDDASAATDMAYEAARLFSKARKSSSTEAADLIAQAEEQLRLAEARDPACALMLQARGDLAHMRGDHSRMATEMQRAVANSRGTRSEKLARRMGLANALGEGGDLRGEETQLRAVLKAAPGHIHARFALGNLLSNSGRKDDAIPELMMALQLPNADPPLEEEQVAQLRGHARRLLCNSLGGASQQAAVVGDHARAVERLERLLKVPGIDANEVAKGGANLATSLAKLGRLAEAEAAASRATAAEASNPTLKALARNSLACCTELRADACNDAEEKTALYATAKALFRAAHEVCPDPASTMGFRRVGAKTHLDLEWTFMIEGQVMHAAGGGTQEVFQGSGMGGGGIARHLKEGVVVEAL